MPFAIWVTGLPGSGKTTIAKAALRLLKKSHISAAYLNMDLLRKKLVKKPGYTSKERDIAYKKFADIGVSLYKQNKNVIFDATAHKLKYRNYARKHIRNFVEIYAKCPLKICIEREAKRKQGKIMAGLYKMALMRKKTGKKFYGLGKVIGVDVKYEENKNAELVIRSDKIGTLKAARIIFKFLFIFIHHINSQ